MDPIKEINTDSIRAMERYNLKPYIIAGIFLFIGLCVFIYFRFSKKKDDDIFDLRF